MAKIIIHAKTPSVVILDPKTPSSRVFETLNTNIAYPILVSEHPTTKVLGSKTYNLIDGSYTYIYFRSFDGNITLPVQEHYTIGYIKQLLHLHGYGFPQYLLLLHAKRSIPDTETVESSDLLNLDDVFVVRRQSID